MDKISAQVINFQLMKVKSKNSAWILFVILRILYFPNCLAFVLLKCLS